MEKDRNLATGHQRPLNNVLYINVREYQRRNKKMDNPEKLATYKTKKNKAKTQQDKQSLILGYFLYYSCKSNLGVSNLPG
jgi:hypothetical protein